MIVFPYISSVVKITKQYSFKHIKNKLLKILILLQQAKIIELHNQIFEVIRLGYSRGFLKESSELE